MMNAESGNIYNACLNGHGTYNSEHFVLRLSMVVHEKLEELGQTQILKTYDPELGRAFSTYLHETIHWWQHIGSTIGFLMSLSRPVQTCTNADHLFQFLKIFGAKKSIRRLLEINISDLGGPSSPMALPNTIFNNFLDLEFFQQLSTNTSNMKEIVNDPLFESVGHTYFTAYAAILNVIAPCLDPSFGVLPNPNSWIEQYDSLVNDKAPAFEYRGPAIIPPVGRFHLFEGQARFAQLQYLFFASGGSWTWEKIEAENMFAEKYLLAFKTFLKITGFEWPKSVHSNQVGLFLLVCDISINPGIGLTEDLPLLLLPYLGHAGFRFTNLCKFIAKNQKMFSDSITEYSKEEYLAVAGELMKVVESHPIDTAGKIAEWPAKSEQFHQLMERHAELKYTNVNLPVQLLTSHLIAFNKDKLRFPEFFCWPGVWMVGSNMHEDVVDLWNRNSAIFADKADDDGIFPRFHLGRNIDIVQDTFQQFYQCNVTFGLTNQWISEPGPFKYDLSWLSPYSSKEDWKRFSQNAFAATYGVSLEDFGIL